MATCPRPMVMQGGKKMGDGKERGGGGGEKVSLSVTAPCGQQSRPITAVELNLLDMVRTEQEGGDRIGINRRRGANLSNLVRTEQEGGENMDSVTNREPLSASAKNELDRNSTRFKKPNTSDRVRDFTR
ncbi:hypothetical protein PoB_000413900 [Plakobranchus ocellatus]|uniref:Uncharacterized protein n=1 Tax=Plakobranchus ocellatus TaxID=259542 RepID=A0AAV3Y6C6_9GAST|nr:hypothetical protein PoB_000413900 [Plakobranchus ocellatus]